MRGPNHVLYVKTDYDATPLASQIIAAECRGAESADAMAAATGVVWQKIESELVSLLGTSGVTALLGRALKLAQREYPVLCTVTLEHDQVTTLGGLHAALERCTPEQAPAVNASVVRHLIILLVTLLGEDIGLMPIRKLWPEVSENPS
jgi:hypothetical protein